jgi:hypothetical protein
VADLRSALSGCVSGSALKNVNSRLPSGLNDEASFLRLTTWSYILLYEVGRVSIRYLLKIPPMSEGSSIQKTKSEKTVETVHCLRTWFFHNLDLEDEKRKKVTEWFLDNCKNIVPKENTHWEKCFVCLCAEMIELVRYCSEVFSLSIAAEEDRNIFLKDFQRRLNRNWAVHEFDEIISDVLSQIGGDLKVVSFRNNNLSTWRNYLESLPEGANLQNGMTRVIERDVINHLNSVLPITSKQIMEALNIDPGPKVKKAISHARQIHENGVQDPDKIIENLKQQWHHIE